VLKPKLLIKVNDMMPIPELKVQTKAIAGKSQGATRIASIDIVRALTMVLMIFVNDLGSLKDIPLWLEHVEPGVDGIGLADTVFPAFLFIVGLSLPFAVENRRKKGDTTMQLAGHVLLRTIALLIMGVFLVNGETINQEATSMRSYAWYSLSCFSFILIWNLYPRNLNRMVILVAKALGIITLVTLAFIYRGGEDGAANRFAPQWWGILGLIGWAYLAAGMVTVLSRDNFVAILVAWMFFCVLSMVNKAGYIPRDSFISMIPNAILGGTLAGLALGGVLTAFVFRHYRSKGENAKMIGVFLSFAALLILFSVITRPYWKLAKLGATPAWLFLCSAFTILAFTAVYWIADVKRKAGWFNIIRPAGTDTLLCYLIPYFLYALIRVTGFHWPDWMITGFVGLLKSLGIALLCVFITGRLNKAGLRLKL
jgi:heparan-alpha-glucosaminide N-acetyltransferase